MTPRETVEAAFRFEEPEVVPYWVIIYPQVEERLDEYYGSKAWRERRVPYMHAAHAGVGLEDLGDGVMRDGFGVVMKQGSITHVIETPLTGPSLDGYEWPDPEALEDWAAVGAGYAQAPDTFRLCGFAYGLFERAWNMRGMENLLMDMVEHPDFVEELLDGVLDVHLKAMDVIAGHVPVEGYYGGDDWCDQRGPIMGIELWRRFFKQRYAALIARAHELGLLFLCHSCGNVLPLIDDLLEIGLDGLESLQPEAMDIRELKRKTAGKMVLVGGLGVQSTLPFGTPDEVRAETRRLIRDMGPGGGYVLAPAKPLMDDVPTENAVAFLETAWDQ